MSWPCGGVCGLTLVQCARRGLGASLSVRAGDLHSSRASLSRKIFRKHARTEMFVSPALTTRALLHIFHRDGPDSLHGSWLGFLAARASVGLFGMVNTINCIAG